MEELFKSLSESVSEECFNDILDMVESIFSTVWNSGLPNRGKLHTKALNNEQNELQDRLKRQFSKVCKERNVNTKPKTKEEITNYDNAVKDALKQAGLTFKGPTSSKLRTSRPTRNNIGEFKTYQRQQSSR